MRRWVLLVTLILAVATGLLIGMLNAEVVTLDVLFTTLQAPLGLIVMITFVSGLLIGVLALWSLRVLPLQFRLKRLQRIEQAQRTMAGVDTSQQVISSPDRSTE